MKYLFHGSNTGNISVLKPHISLEFKSLVYATSDWKYALVRAGKQLDLIREEYYGPDKPFELAECYPGAFKQMFDCPGYIYLLADDDFIRNENGEYVSEKEVIPLGCVRIDNIWSEMMRLKGYWDYEFVWDGDEEYWKGVRGGREGFLKRKRANKQKMLELRKEFEA